MVILFMQTVSRNNWYLYLGKERDGFKYTEKARQFKVVVDGSALRIHISICNCQLMAVAEDFSNTLWPYGVENWQP